MAGHRMIYGCDGAGALSPGNTALHTRVSSSSSSQPLDSLFLSRSSPSFMGSTSMVSFEDVNGGKRPERSLFRSSEDDNNVDEELDEYTQQPGKKRRLTVDQVQFLEKSFEVENKLEPERKSQLAKDLGLQPRQVAIWFQNRRARWKSKQLEKDYDVLQSSYNSLKADYEELLKEKEKLNAEVLHFREKLHLEQKEKTDLDESDNEKPPKSPLKAPVNESASGDKASKDPAVAYKPEDKTSAKSDFLNGDSPRYTGGHSSLLEAGDTSYVFEPDQSDLSQDEEDNFSKSMLIPSQYIFPKMELDDYSGHYGFPVDDQTLEFWPY